MHLGSQQAGSAGPAAHPVGTLMSVNVGKPKDVPWQGRTVFTGVFKDPVAGPRRVRKLNVDGDGQGDLAGHGGEQRAVFVYQIESYRYWERELGRNDFVNGQFGENFTIEGLHDDEVCIGDRYQIGTAVFEVTQPRVTCYRVGIRMNDPRIPALLVSHRRPGFYFRVLREGEVQAGDEIIKLASGPDRMTVAEVDALLYLPGHPRQQLLRALRIPALSPGWQTSFRALLAGDHGSGNAGLVATSPPPAWTGFRRLKVTGIERESDTVISIRLEDPDGGALPSARPGQYLTLRLEPDKQERSLLRNYSLSGPPGADYYRITVKREHDGVASGYLHSRVAVGDQLEIAAPRGTFILDQTDAPVLLVSAGIGATPVLAMLHALATEHSDREIWWLHDARRTWKRPDDRVRTQQPRGPVERRLREPARTRGVMRRACSVVVPDRRLPQLRDDAHRRQPRLQPRPSRTPCRRQRAHLLLAPARQRRARSVTGRHASPERLRHHPSPRRTLPGSVGAAFPSRRSGRCPRCSAGWSCGSSPPGARPPNSPPASIRELAPFLSMRAADFPQAVAQHISDVHARAAGNAM